MYRPWEQWAVLGWHSGADPGVGYLRILCSLSGQGKYLLTSMFFHHNISIHWTKVLIYWIIERNIYILKKSTLEILGHLVFDRPVTFNVTFLFQKPWLGFLCPRPERSAEASSNQIVCASICLSFCLSVCLSFRNSVPLTNKVQFKVWEMIQ